MPFDGSGNFTRVHDWTQDRDNGIKILATRMDEEFDNFTAGMNVVFFRNGLVPMSGNLNMGQNSIYNIAAGSVGNPSIKFGDDPNSGIYLDGMGKVAIASNNVKRLEANTTGMSVFGALSANGTIDASGAITTAGGVTATSNITSSANIVGVNGTFSGAVTAPSHTGATFTGTGAGTFNSLAIAANGTFGGNVQAASVQAASGVITGASFTVNGSQVWTAANDGAGSGLDADLLDGLNSTAFAQLTGATFSGAIQAPSGAITSSSFTVNGSQVWTAANDGAGSGMDADTLDGIQGSGYQTTLGYTPANKAGDTFTGSVNIDIAGIGFGTWNTTNINGAYCAYARNGTSSAFIGHGSQIISGGSVSDFGITVPSGNMVFGTGSAERMRIDSSGNVGIGVSGAPTTKLDVRGTLQIRQSDSSYIRLNSTATVATVEYSNTAGLRFFYNGTTEHARFDSSGNFGVGMSPSGYRVDVSGTVRSTAGFRGQNGSLIGALNVSDGINVNIGAESNHPVQFLTNNTVRADITAAGVFSYGGLEIGYRDIPRVTGGIERGKVFATSAGFTLNTGTAAGGAYSVYNDSAGVITITQGSGLTLRLAGTTTTGSRTLAARSFATIWFNSTTEAIMSGAGVT